MANEPSERNSSENTYRLGEALETLDMAQHFVVGCAKRFFDNPTLKQEDELTNSAWLCVRAFKTTTGAVAVLPGISPSDKRDIILDLLEYDDHARIERLNEIIEEEVCFPAEREDGNKEMSEEEFNKWVESIYSIQANNLGIDIGNFIAQMCLRVRFISQWN